MTLYPANIRGILNPRAYNSRTEHLSESKRVKSVLIVVFHASGTPREE